jgi:hypothetical protein
MNGREFGCQDPLSDRLRFRPRMRANWHPHRHLLVTDGGFRPDGTFVSWPTHDTARLMEAFRRPVLRLFVRLELFDEEQAAGMMTWPPSGSYVHTAAWVGHFGCRRMIACSRRASRATARGIPSPWSGSRMTGPTSPRTLRPAPRRCTRRSSSPGSSCTFQTRGT